MTGWSCRYESGESYCDRVKVGCVPGMLGCALRGKIHFIYDEEGQLILPSDWEGKKDRPRRVKKSSV